MKLININLHELIGRDVDSVVKYLEEAGIGTTTMTQDFAGPLAMLMRLSPPPSVQPGHHVRVIESGNKVVNFLADRQASADALRGRVGSLEERVADLERRGRKDSSPRKRRGGG